MIQFGGMYSGTKWLKIKGKFLDVVMNMYKNIKSCVFANGAKSKFFASLAGIRQGEYLALLLFALFVNDLEGNLLQNGY